MGLLQVASLYIRVGRPFWFSRGLSDSEYLASRVGLLEAVGPIGVRRNAHGPLTPSGRIWARISGVRVGLFQQ